MHDGSSAPLLWPVDWREGFEAGHTAGWESWPPFQDVAYDTTLFPGRWPDSLNPAGCMTVGEYFIPRGIPPSFDGGKGQAGYLLRVVRPHSATPQRLGFTRRLKLFTNSNLRLSFDLFRWPGHGVHHVCAEVAAGDGRLYRSRQELAPDAWQHFTLTRDQFFEESGAVLPAGLSLDALMIHAELERPNPAQAFLLGLDNLDLHAARQAGFLPAPAIATPIYPGADWLPLLWPELIQIGARTRLVLQPEAEINSGQVRLAGPRESPVMQIPLESRDGRWYFTLDDLLQPPATGAHLLEVRGVTGDGKLIVTQMRCWLTNSTQRSQRLCFSAADWERGRQRVTDPAWEACGRRLREDATSGRARFVPGDPQFEMFPPEHLLTQAPHYFDVLRGSAQAAWHNALDWKLNRNPTAHDFACETLLRMCAWSTWTHPAFPSQGRRIYYPAGHALLLLAFAADVLWNDLSNEERQRVTAGFLRNGIQPAFEEYCLHNRAPSHTSNWISHICGGALLALLLLHGQIPARDWMSYFLGLAEKFLAWASATWLPDGSYGEGYWYQNFSLESAWPVLATLEAVLGLEQLPEQLHFSRGIRYALRIMAADGTLQDLGDSADVRINTAQRVGELVQRNDAGLNGATAANWLWLARHARDPELDYFCGLSESIGWEALLFGRDRPAQSVPAPALRSAHFEHKGHVVFRSEAGGPACVLTFHAGPNFNHNHADQGHIRLWAAGGPLLTELGKSSYYTDPYYGTLNIQAGGHNALLVDGYTEAQELADYADPNVSAWTRHGRMAGVMLGEPCEWAAAELAEVYRGWLRRWRRDVIFLHTGCILLRDQVEAAGRERDFSALLHLLPGSSPEFISPNHLVLTSGMGGCDFYLLQSCERLELGRMPLTTADFAEGYPERPLRERPVIRLHQRGHHAQFMVLIVPWTQTQPRAAFTHESENAWSFSAGGFTDVWRASADIPIEIDDFALDGSLIWTRRADAGISHLFALDVKQWSGPGCEINASSSPLTIRWQAGNDCPKLSLVSIGTQQVRLKLPGGTKMFELKPGRQIDIPLEK